MSVLKISKESLDELYLRYKVFKSYLTPFGVRDSCKTHPRACPKSSLSTMFFLHTKDKNLFVGNIVCTETSDFYFTILLDSGQKSFGKSSPISKRTVCYVQEILWSCDACFRPGGDDCSPPRSREHMYLRMTLGRRNVSRKHTCIASSCPVCPGRSRYCLLPLKSRR
jgi:hypothetical protein